MYQLYNIDNNKKSNIKGFWLDKNNKLYIDNIHIKYSYKYPKNDIKKLFDNNELSIFYKKISKKSISDNEKTIAYILDKEGKKTILKTCIIKKYTIYNDIDNIIINTILKHGGCTVFYNGINVIIEIWSK